VEPTTEPGGRGPAPAPLRLAQEFLNTVDRDVGQEVLVAPADLKRWMTEHGLLGRRDPVTERDFARAIDVREAIRRAAVANNIGTPDPEGERALNGFARRLRLSVRTDGGQASVEPDASGVDGALGRILGVVYTSMIDGTWARFKACLRCQWAFFDGSKNRSGVWCSMSYCGSRVKAKSYRLRRIDEERGTRPPIRGTTGRAATAEPAARSSRRSS
jgi:predicted RNA-binding Zn ribbon-like protein